MITGPDTHGDPASIPLGSLIAGRYQTRRLLGEGGFGAVFEALDRTTGGRVALKVMSASVLAMAGGQERFRREVDIVRKLNHPNIVKVLDASIDDRGTLYIAFELLEGRPLEDEMAKVGAMPVRRAAIISMQVLAALDTAHAANIIHRDLKPANVFLLNAEHDHAKLLDFGIAKSTNANSQQGLTQNGMMLGTPAYMSPEQLFGKPVGPSSDLFAFGIVMAEMVAGKSLYSDDISPMTILQERVMKGRVPIPDAVLRSPLGDVIAKATALEPAQRYATAKEMRAAVEAALTVAESQPYGGRAHMASSPNLGGHSPSYPSAVPGTSASFPPAYGTQPGSPSGPYGAPLTEQGQVPKWPPPPPVAQRRGSGGAVVGLVVGLIVLSVIGIAAGLYFMLGDSKSEPTKKHGKKSTATSTAEADVTPTAVATPPTAKPTPTPTLGPTSAPTPTTILTLEPNLPGSAVPGERVVERTCTGVAALNQGSLKRALTKAGFSVKGTLLFCSGDMINFRCMGPEARGYTVDLGGGKEGSGSLMKVKTAAAAQTLVKSEVATGKGPLTLAHDGPNILRLEMPPESAAKVLADVCK